MKSSKLFLRSLALATSAMAIMSTQASAQNPISPSKVNVGETKVSDTGLLAMFKGLMPYYPGDPSFVKVVGANFVNPDRYDGSKIINVQLMGPASLAALDSVGNLIVDAVKGNNLLTFQAPALQPISVPQQGSNVIVDLNLIAQNGVQPADANAFKLKLLATPKVATASMLMPQDIVNILNSWNAPVLNNAGFVNVTSAPAPAAATATAANAQPTAASQWTLGLVMHDNAQPSQLTSVTMPTTAFARFDGILPGSTTPVPSCVGVPVVTLGSKTYKGSALPATIPVPSPAADVNIVLTEMNNPINPGTLTIILTAGNGAGTLSASGLQTFLSATFTMAANNSPLVTTTAGATLGTTGWTAKAKVENGGKIFQAATLDPVEFNMNMMIGLPTIGSSPIGFNCGVTGWKLNVGSELVFPCSNGGADALSFSMNSGAIGIVPSIGATAIYSLPNATIAAVSQQAGRLINSGSQSFYPPTDLNSFTETVRNAVGITDGDTSLQTYLTQQNAMAVGLQAPITNFPTRVGSRFGFAALNGADLHNIEWKHTGTFVQLVADGMAYNSDDFSRFVTMTNGAATAAEIPEGTSIMFVNPADQSAVLFKTAEALTTPTATAGQLSVTPLISASDDFFGSEQETWAGLLSKHFVNVMKKVTAADVTPASDTNANNGGIVGVSQGTVAQLMGN